MTCQEQQCQCYPFCLVKEVVENCVIHQKYKPVTKVQENEFDEDCTREYNFEDFCQTPYHVNNDC